MLFNQLGLTAELLRAVQSQGYETATPVQHKAIPLILEGRDILAGAQTGTGKTAGFTLPMLQKLQHSQKNRRSIRALVLTPTRELAEQITAEIRTFAGPVRTAAVYGGVGYGGQLKALSDGGLRVAHSVE